MRADVEWSRDRLRSVVSEPAVVFGVLFAVLVPVTLLADISRRLRGVPELLVDGLTVLTATLYTVAVAYVITAALMKVRRSQEVGPARRNHRGRRFARFLRMAAFASFALSGIWRFAPEPLSHISAWAWACFGVALIGNVVVLVARGLVAGARALALRKVSS